MPMMPMCSKCQKRMANIVVKNGDKEEAYCIKCARESSLPYAKDFFEKMGISDEDLDAMSTELSEMLKPSDADDNEDGGAPAINFPAIFQNLGFPFKQPMKSGEKKEKGDPAQDTKKKKERKFLSLYCHDLTKKASEGKIDRIIGREKELERMIQILCRRQKNNPCLIGEPGVGKTAIAEALALRIVSGEVPYRLRDAEVFLVDLTALVAGTQFRGQFESRILGLLNEVKAAGNIILVIDEVHNIVGSGDAEGSMNAANIMKPALSRGEVQVIGATTLKEYRKYIEKDSALERRFQPIIVKEPSIDESIEMLKGIKGYYEAFHRIKIPDAVVKSAVVLSERYITDRFLPDKAIDLLDESASHVALHSDVLNDFRKNEDAQKALAEEKSNIEALPDGDTPEKQEEKYKLLADVKVRELQLLDEEARLRPLAENVEVTVSDLAEVIEIWTGVPATSISETEFSHLDGLSARLSDRIVGQSDAIQAVTRAIKRKRAGVSSKKSPVSFIFAGPTGVGKTELVKVLSADLFREPENLIRLDMSEFMEKHSVSRIIGAPPGYVGYDEAGQLTEKIRRRPYSVILFDEIEKAHPDVLNILLQILDDGHITDASGRQINFENTVIVMTTNAGSERSSAISGFTGNKDGSLEKERTMRALSDFLRPEFINRVDEIITFARLSKEDFKAIAAIQLSDLKKTLTERGISFTYTPQAEALIAEESYSEKFGARNMRRYIQNNVEDPLAEAVIASYENAVIGAHLDVKEDKLSISVI